MQSHFHLKHTVNLVVCAPMPVENQYKEVPVLLRETNLESALEDSVFQCLQVPNTHMCIANFHFTG